MVDLRQKLKSALENGIKNKDEIAVATIRLIIAALKDRDIENRTKKKEGDTPDSEIFNLFQSMIKQRKDSKKIYDDAGRVELSQREESEIKIISQFLPTQMNDEDIKKIIKELVQEVQAESIKDLGKLMQLVKERYPGQFDMKKAADFGKKILS
tara:strand:+ start:20 stop:481 length:462 start_codon:yes stop_codon:yes gene_type:complete